MAFLAEDLITSIKIRSMVPSSQQTFLDPSFLLLVNEEMGINLLPDLISAREDMFLKRKTIPLVSGQATYFMPTRAIGNSAKAVVYVDSSGGKYELPQLTPEKVFASQYSDGNPMGVYFENDKICLVPTPNSNQGSVEVWYYSRPSELVLSTSCGKVESLSDDGTTLTITLDKSIESDVANGALVDVLNTSSPFNLDLEDVTITTSVGTVITAPLASFQDSNGTLSIAVGDYVCAAGTSNIPMVPQEFHPILAQMVACRMLEALGDLQKLQAANGKLAEMRMQAFKLIANRIETSNKKINNLRSIHNSMR